MSRNFFTEFEERSMWTDEHINRMKALGVWGDLSLSDYLDIHADERGEKVAVQDDYQQLTWAELQHETDQLAAGLHDLGVERGDRVSLQIPNRVEWFVARLGILRAGAVVSTMMPRFREKEMTHIIKAVEPTVYIGPADYGDYNHVETVMDIQQDVETLSHIVATNDGDVHSPSGAVDFEDLKSSTEGFFPQNIPSGYPDRIKTSGGTTGLPKVFYWPMYTRMGVLGPLLDRLGITRHDSVLAMAPFPHGISTPIGCTGVFMLGATSILTEPSRTPTEHWETIRDVKPSVATAAPTQLNKMRNADYHGENALDSLRILFYSGEPLAQDTAQYFESLGPRITGFYGAGVAGAPLVSCPGDSQKIRTTTVGKPIRGSEVSVVNNDGEEVEPGEVGEIVWTGATLTPGYLDPEKNDEAFEQDERGRYWFQSEDAGSMDEAGNFEVKGRLDDMILRGGTNIFPAAIEEEIVKLDAVREVAVVGMPDPEYGQKACAFIVSSSELALEDITDFLDDQGLAKYKWPERLEQVARIPKTAAGKIQKIELQNRIKDKLQTEGKID